MNFLNSVHKSGVVNIEMESLSFAALTHHAGIRSAVICVTLLDRLKGDQVSPVKSFSTVRSLIQLPRDTGSGSEGSPRRMAAEASEARLEIYKKIFSQQGQAHPQGWSRINVREKPKTLQTRSARIRKLRLNILF